MTARQRYIESDKVTMREFVKFQNDVGRTVTEDINRHEDKLERVIERLDARFKADKEASEARLNADRAASEARLKADREEFILRFAEERKEWRSTKRWLYLNFGGVIALIITVAIAIIGFIVTNGNMLR